MNAHDHLDPGEPSRTARLVEMAEWAQFERGRPPNCTSNHVVFESSITKYGRVSNGVWNDVDVRSVREETATHGFLVPSLMAAGQAHGIYHRGGVAFCRSSLLMIERITPVSFAAGTPCKSAGCTLWWCQHSAKSTHTKVTVNGALMESRQALAKSATTRSAGRTNEARTCPAMSIRTHQRRVFASKNKLGKRRIPMVLILLKPSHAYNFPSLPEFLYHESCAD